MRQGRRVPAAGPDVPLRAQRHPDDGAQAHARQAGADLAADQARPRALHPLLPLHPLLGERLGGPAAGDREPRRPLGDHDVRGAPLRRRVLRQRHRALPGRRADVDHLPLPRPAVGDAAGAHGLRPLRRRLQHGGDHPRGQGRARAVPQPPRGGRGLAVRQGPLRAHGADVRGPDHRCADPRRTRARAGRGARRPRARRRPAAGDRREVRPGIGRDPGLRRADQRGGARLGAPPARGAGRRPVRLGPRGRRRLGVARALHGPDRRHRRGRARWSSWATSSRCTGCR